MQVSSTPGLFYYKVKLLWMQYVVCLKPARSMHEKDMALGKGVCFSKTCVYFYNGACPDVQVALPIGTNAPPYHQ